MGTGRVGAWWKAALVAALALGAWARPAVGAADPDRPAAGQLYLLVNAERSNAGLPPLVPSADAAEVAELWSQFMADLGDLAHNDGWFTSDSKRRVGAGAVGENVATNIDVADAHRRLMNSPGHRANILDPRFTHVGIGVVKGPSGAWWITEDFFQLQQVPAPPPPAPAPAPPTTAPPAPPGPAAAPVPTPSPVVVPPQDEPRVDGAAGSFFSPGAAGTVEAAAIVPPSTVAPEPDELPASDPPLEMAAGVGGSGPAGAPARPAVVPVGAALLLLAANVQRVRTLRRR